VSAPAQSNSEVIEAYLNTVMCKDASVVDRFFDPDVEYMVNGTPTPDPEGVLPLISAECHAAVPWLGLNRGRRAMREFLAHMHRNLEVTAFGPREVNSDGNKAAGLPLVSPPRAVDRPNRGDLLLRPLRAPGRVDRQISLPGKHIRCRIDIPHWRQLDAGDRWRTTSSADVVMRI